MLLDWEQLAAFLRSEPGAGRKYRDRLPDNADPVGGLLDHASFIYDTTQENPLKGAAATVMAPGYNLVKQSVAEGRSPALAYLPGFNFNQPGSSPGSLNDVVTGGQALGIGLYDYLFPGGFDNKSMAGRKLQDDEKFPIQRLLEMLQR